MFDFEGVVVFLFEGAKIRKTCTLAKKMYLVGFRMEFEKISIRCSEFYYFCNIDKKWFDEIMGTSLLFNRIIDAQDPTQVEGLSRFFKTGKGQYGEGDKFLGIKVPVTREVVKTCWQDTSFDDLETCIRSEYHEMRLAALLTLVQIFKHAKKDKALQQQCVDFYLAHTQYINNWDLVDLSCYELLGTWLLDKDRTLLYDLARDGKTIWEQRIGMVSTMQFIRHGQVDDTYAIADIFLAKPLLLHDLLQKAVGWLLREAGKRDEQRLKDWLSTRYQSMPRTMLRYAIEKFPEEERLRFLQSKAIS
jgi:3-methyladenine DNA glycosylase AlkD